MFYSYGTALQHNEITCKHTGALSVWCECTQNIFNQCFEANINTKQRWAGQKGHYNLD